MGTGREAAGDRRLHRAGRHLAGRRQSGHRHLVCHLQRDGGAGHAVPDQGRGLVPGRKQHRTGLAEIRGGPGQAARGPAAGIQPSGPAAAHRPAQHRRPRADGAGRDRRLRGDPRRAGLRPCAGPDADPAGRDDRYRLGQGRDRLRRRHPPGGQADRGQAGRPGGAEPGLRAADRVSAADLQPRGGGRGRAALPFFERRQRADGRSEAAGAGPRSRARAVAGPGAARRHADRLRGGGRQQGLPHGDRDPRSGGHRAGLQPERARPAVCPLRLGCQSLEHHAALRFRQLRHAALQSLRSDHEWRRRGGRRHGGRSLPQRRGGAAQCEQRQRQRRGLRQRPAGHRHGIRGSGRTNLRLLERRQRPVGESREPDDGRDARAALRFNPRELSDHGRARRADRGGGGPAGVARLGECQRRLPLPRQTRHLARRTLCHVGTHLWQRLRRCRPVGEPHDLSLCLLGGELGRRKSRLARGRGDPGAAGHRAGLGLRQRPQFHQLGRPSGTAAVLHRQASHRHRRSLPAGCQRSGRAGVHR